MSSTSSPALASALRAAGAGHRGGDDPGAWGEAEVGAHLLAADGHDRGPVDDAGAVAGVVDVVDALDPVVLLQRHVVEAGVPADLGEGRLETGQPLGRGVGADQLVVVEHGETVEIDDRDDRAVEVAVGPGLRGPVVRLGGERVDVLAGPALEGRDQVGADALGHEADAVVGLRVGGPGTAVGAHGHAAHRLEDRKSVV